ncbi:hypothetical protein ACYCVF_31415 [Bradyrhizobium sp. 1.29L]
MRIVGEVEADLAPLAASRGAGEAWTSAADVKIVAIGHAKSKGKPEWLPWRANWCDPNVAYTEPEERGHSFRRCDDCGLCASSRRTAPKRKLSRKTAAALVWRMAPLAVVMLLSNDMSMMMMVIMMAPDRQLHHHLG